MAEEQQPVIETSPVFRKKGQTVIIDGDTVIVKKEPSEQQQAPQQLAESRAIQPTASYSESPLAFSGFGGAATEAIGLPLPDVQRGRGRERMAASRVVRQKGNVRETVTRFAVFRKQEILPPAPKKEEAAGLGGGGFPEMKMTSLAPQTKESPFPKFPEMKLGGGLGGKGKQPSFPVVTEMSLGSAKKGMKTPPFSFSGFGTSLDLGSKKQKAAFPKMPSLSLGKGARGSSVFSGLGRSPRKLTKHHKRRR